MLMDRQALLHPSFSWHQMISVPMGLGNVWCVGPGGLSVMMKTDPKVLHHVQVFIN